MAQGAGGREHRGYCTVLVGTGSVSDTAVKPHWPYLASEITSTNTGSEASPHKIHVPEKPDTTE